MSTAPAMPAALAECFEHIALPHRASLLRLRDQIFEVAAETPRIGVIEEALRWREPAYLTSTRKSGSTIRLGIEKGADAPALFFNCKTTLVEEFRQQFGSTLRYSKNRAVLIGAATPAQDTALRLCIHAALTYHLRH
jgi:hypothetical protein